MNFFTTILPVLAIFALILIFRHFDFEKVKERKEKEEKERLELEKQDRRFWRQHFARAIRTNMMGRSNPEELEELFRQYFELYRVDFPEATEEEARAFALNTSTPITIG